MTVYVRHTTRPIKYRQWLRPWYRFLDWWQGGDIAARFWTSRTGRVLCWLVPKLIVALWVALKLVVFGAVIIGGAVLFMACNAGVGGGALNKAARKANR